jgi:hypothetical protein
LATWQIKATAVALTTTAIESRSSTELSVYSSFLGRVQETKAKTPRSITAYERDGDVIWLGRLPNHPAIGIAHPTDESGTEDPLLTMDRVPRTAPPNAPDVVVPWLENGFDDPNVEPSLMSQLFEEVPEGETAETEMSPEEPKGKAACSWGGSRCTLKVC